MLNQIQTDAKNAEAKLSTIRSRIQDLRTELVQLETDEAATATLHDYITSLLSRAQAKTPSTSPAAVAARKRRAEKRATATVTDVTPDPNA